MGESLFPLKNTAVLPADDLMRKDKELVPVLTYIIGQIS